MNTMSIATRVRPNTLNAERSRIFSTETVNSGLPIHIAARLLGHLDLNTTQGYVAVYPAE
jgi:site-specific recombinase XerD